VATLVNNPICFSLSLAWSAHAGFWKALKIWDKAVASAKLGTGSIFLRISSDFKASDILQIWTTSSEKTSGADMFFGDSSL